MPRADLIINLVKASSKGDKSFFRQTLETLVAEERKKQHHVFANRLEEYLRLNGTLLSKAMTASDDRQQNLFVELMPQKQISDLVLPSEVERACQELIEEYNRIDVLRAHNIEPRHRVLLVGPPGNGKTSLAEAIAYSLMVPLVVVRYDGVIGSYLGETSSRLKKVFDYVRTRQCVLFFDEFDTIGKERGDAHETGEIKRVVSSLLLQIDELPSHVLVLTATNHPELLDRATWRRFQLRLELPRPDRHQLSRWFNEFEKGLGVSLGIKQDLLVKEFEGLSFSEVEEFCSNIIRRKVLSMNDESMKDIVKHQLSQWRSRFTLKPTQGKPTTLSNGNQ